MSIIAIYQDSKSFPTTCRSCRAPIEWAETVAGKRIPFDDIVVLRTEGSPLTDRVIEYIDTSVSPTHFATCPDANAWRKRKP